MKVYISKSALVSEETVDRCEKSIVEAHGIDVRISRYEPKNRGYRGPEKEIGKVDVVVFLCKCNQQKVVRSSSKELTETRFWMGKGQISELNYAEENDIPHYYMTDNDTNWFKSGEGDVHFSDPNPKDWKYHCCVTSNCNDEQLFTGYGMLCQAIDYNDKVPTYKEESKPNSWYGCVNTEEKVADYLNGNNVDTCNLGLLDCQKLQGNYDGFVWDCDHNPDYNKALCNHFRECHQREMMEHAGISTSLDVMTGKGLREQINTSESNTYPWHYAKWIDNLKNDGIGFINSFEDSNVEITNPNNILLNLL